MYYSIFEIKLQDQPKSLLKICAVKAPKKAKRVLDCFLKSSYIRHTFATNLVNGQKQTDGSIKSLTPKQVADLLGHSTSQITEMYYVKKDTSRLNGITDGFEM